MSIYLIWCNCNHNGWYIATFYDKHSKILKFYSKCANYFQKHLYYEHEWGNYGKIQWAHKFIWLIPSSISVITINFEITCNYVLPRIVIVFVSKTHRNQCREYPYFAIFDILLIKLKNFECKVIKTHSMVIY